MQTQAAKKFIEAALSLSEEIQGEIYAIIQSPVTKVHNEEIITREELLKALQLENPAKSDNPVCKSNFFCSCLIFLFVYCLLICREHLKRDHRRRIAKIDELWTRVMLAYILLSQAHLLTNAKIHANLSNQTKTLSSRHVPI